MQSLAVGTIPIIPDLEGRRVLVTGAELHPGYHSYYQKFFTTIYGLEECMGFFATEISD